MSPSEKAFGLFTGSRPDYENLVCDIEYRGSLCARVHEEKGIGTYGIEIFSNPADAKWSFDIEDFQAALAAAAEDLSRLGPKRPS